MTTTRSIPLLLCSAALLLVGRLGRRGVVAVVDGHDLAPVFETARMYTGAIRPLALERVFGVTTFELG